MKHCWLRCNGSAECLVFLSGWGMGPEPFAELAASHADVLLLYDYRSMDDAVFAELIGREHLYLLAWSMGVWAAAWLKQRSRIFSALHFQSATAVGGTLRPVDDRCGIPVQGFTGMLRDLSAENIEVFYRSMFEREKEAEYFLCRRPQRACEELREELACLHERCLGSSELPDIFSHRIVTSRDRIFPARNQLRAWGRHRCHAAALPHFSFYRQNEKELRTDLFQFN
jgi:pimeloyl-[acyl-carrier protein] methyl ester esterase